MAQVNNNAILVYTSLHFHIQATSQFNAQCRSERLHSSRDWQKIPFTVIYTLHAADAVDASDAVFRRTG